ncbi:MAG: hypothetical protein SGI72_08995 [Planctomycetota bacterium]|nr:hypothetical protein [Planctomycetota bacterium]
MWLRCILPLALLFQQPTAPVDEPASWIDPDLRVEHFVVYTKRVETGRAPTVDVVGFVEMRRRDGRTGVQLECDSRFLVGSLGTDARRSVQRVLHVESPTDRGPRCMWREIGPGTGRSVEAEWSRDGNSLEISEWSAGPKRTGTLIVSSGASMPLSLVELLRAGQLTSGSIVVFDPLALTLEPLFVKTVWLDDSEAIGEDPDVDTASLAALRTVELVRQDGSLAGRYRFRGRSLVAFQWQEGATFARIVDAAQFESLLSQHAEPLVKSTQTR